MGLKVGGIRNTFTRSYIQPINYKDNKQAGAVEAVNPLSLSVDVIKKSQEANSLFNSVAQKFEGMIVGYSEDSSGFSYGVQGSTVDIFA